MLDGGKGNDVDSAKFPPSVEAVEVVVRTEGCIDTILRRSCISCSETSSAATNAWTACGFCIAEELEPDGICRSRGGFGKMVMSEVWEANDSVFAARSLPLFV